MKNPLLRNTQSSSIAVGKRRPIILFHVINDFMGLDNSFSKATDYGLEYHYLIFGKGRDFHHYIFHVRYKGIK
jgi:hypothetical protein